MHSLQRKYFALFLIFLQLSADVIAASNVIRSVADMRLSGTAVGLSYLVNDPSSISSSSSSSSSASSPRVVSSVGLDADSQRRLRASASETDMLKTLPSHMRHLAPLIADLVNMDHPDFVSDKWHKTLHNHVREMYKRGARLEWQGQPMDNSQMEKMMMAFNNLETMFNNSTAQEAARLSQIPPVANVSYATQPINARDIIEGLLTGAGSVFVPGLKDAENGTEALSVVASCIDFRKFREPFLVQDLFSAQDEVATISDDDINQFASMTAMASKSSLDVILDKLTNLPTKVWKVWKYMSAIMKKMAPYMLNILKHAYKCGLVDIVLGFVVSFLIGIFPPLLFILMPLGIIMMAVEFFTQIKAMVDNWSRNWFRFGKATGTIAAYIAILIISYKANESNKVSCVDKKGCSYNMPSDENKRWSRSDFKHCPSGNTCNKVFQRDDIIDPNKIDNLGRTNLQRMKQGVAPIGPDGRSVNLHHVTQTQDGSIAELTETFHTVNHKELHTFLKKGEPSRINRELFDAWRTSYWRARGAQFESGAITQAARSSLVQLAPLGTVVVKAINEQGTNVVDYVEQLMRGFISGNTPDDPSTYQGLSFSSGMSYTDILRYVLWTLIDDAKDAAQAMDSAVVNTLNGGSSGSSTFSCSWNATCSQPAVLSPEKFDRVDGQLRYSTDKKYQFRFAPDTGFALKVAVRVNEGSMQTSLQRVRMGGALEPVPSSVARPTSKLVVAVEDVPDDDKMMAAPAPTMSSSSMMQSMMGMMKRAVFGDSAPVTAASSTDPRPAPSSPDAVHLLTLQHCDGYGDYQLVLNGRRFNATLPPSKDPTWYQFWNTQGSRPDANDTLFDVSTQYVPYPTLPDQTVSVVGDPKPYSVSLQWASLTNVMDDAEGSVPMYHVYYTSDPAVVINNWCDADTKTQYAGSTAATQMVVNGLSSSTAYRFFVFGEGAGKALSMYGRSSGKAELQSAMATTQPVLSAGAIVGIVIGVVACIALIAVAMLYVLRHKRMLNIELPHYDRYLKRVVMK